MWTRIVCSTAVLVVTVAAHTTQSQEHQKPAVAASAGESKLDGPRLHLSYAVIVRLPDETRKRVFAELSACRADVMRNADEQFPVLTLEDKDYSPKRDVEQFRRRSRFEDAGVIACNRRIEGKHSITNAELRSITAEGVCRQWPPLTGRPLC